MSDKFFAVLTEVVSIQKYVFGSNKLKENLGASWLIQQIYKDPLREAVKKVLPSINGYDFDAWWKSPDVIQMNNGADFEIGYIGGGNALLFFKEEEKTEGEKAKEFIKEWTKSLLVQSPGVVTAVACDEFDLNNNFPDEISKIFKGLHQNKYSQIPQTIIPRHGITAECSHSGYSMDIWNDKAPTKEDKDYVSSVAYAKINSSNEATKKLEDGLKDVLNDKYCFTDELDNLGQQTGESHIAVVHIDGNGMGKRFQEANSLPNLRNLSFSVKSITDNSFEKLIKHIVDNFPKIQEALGYTDKSKWPKKKDSTGNDKDVLPIRPIIIGGDDIAFVSEGRLGIYFAKLFLEFFETEGEKVSDKKGLSACAGIAITKTKYPFYRGYQLSEELCSNAKQIRKGKKDNGSWLDFHVAYGGFSGTLEEIRKNHHKAPMGELCFRPYKIKDNGERGFELLVQNTKALIKKDNFPKNKLKELRQVLTLGQESIDIFRNHIKARGLKLPEIKGKNYHKLIYENGETPYFDMIEFIEYYPSFEL
jgi:hypothetical protein